MGDIEIISASAGSGKTYRLATELERALESDVRPDAVLATTFTIKAAGELRHRARGQLVAIGRLVEAQRLEAAPIGTIHSVCNRLIHDFAFERGTAPVLGVLDQEAARALRARVQAEVLDEDAQGELHDLAARLNGYVARDGDEPWAWQADVGTIIDLARDNDLDDDALRRSCDRSVDSLLELLGPSADDGAAIDDALLPAIESFIGGVPVDDTTKATRGAVDRAERAARDLRAGRHLPWSEWAALAKLAPGAKSRPAVEALHAAAERHDRHPRLRADLRDAVTRVFDLAIESRRVYREHKHRMCVQDFTDQEVGALQLLERDDVRDSLRSSVDLVLVDEFQDTSPIELAIFLRLAEIAPRSIWVGDQKQSIYAFRGTDPGLMDAATERILGSDEPETLARSYRSRHELVKLTSDLFTPPFADQGLSASRVRLEPTAAPDELGPVVERWCIDAKNKADDIAALAATTRELIADADVRIRDPHTGETRRVRASDVAILCRVNDTATAVAQALTEQGIGSILQQPGLIETTEGRVLLAALQLWVDPRDALAAASIARIVAFPDRPDEWLETVLGTPGADAFADEPCVHAVLSARSQPGSGGTLFALDAVIAALDLPHLCARWGDTATRMANVEAFRAHAAAYVACEDEAGAACTVAGFVRTMLHAAKDAEDSQGVPSDAAGVTVSTWHGAKGLEWPVVVLFELGYAPREFPVLGARIATDAASIDIAAPLAGRWIRYWPQPYGRGRASIPFFDRVADHSACTDAEAAERREQLRLLYVGWTRARDRIVLAARPGKLTDKGALNLLTDAPPSDLETPPPGEETVPVSWAGHDLRIRVRRAAPTPPATAAPTVTRTHARGALRAHPPAVVSPSALAAVGHVGEPIRLGGPLDVRGDHDWRHLGNAIHGFLAADAHDLDDDARLAIATRLMRAWRVDDALDATTIRLAADRLRTWIDDRWPDAIWRRECPVAGRDEPGTVTRGEIDLLIETPDARVVIDHKSFPGTIAQAIERAATYAGQLTAYADLVQRAGGDVKVETYVHMPVAGIVLPLVR